MPANKASKKKTSASKPKVPLTKKSSTVKKKSFVGKKISKEIIDGVPVSEMTKEQLIQHIQHQKTDLESEQEERNYFQVERDKIQDFWDISKKQLEQKQFEILEKDKEIEDIEKKYEQEIELYKKRIKYMLHEQKSELSINKIDNVKSLQSAQENFLLSENDFFRNQSSLKKQLRETEISFQEVIKDLKLKHNQEVSKLKNDLQQNIQENESKYKSKVKKVCDDMDAKYKIKIYNIEEEKNKQISTLMERHVDAFNEMRNHYNSITQENVSMIENLKQHVEELKKKEENLDQQVMRLNSSNKLLADQLPKVEQNNCELQKKLQNYDKDKDALLKTRVRLSKKKSEIKQLQCEMEMVRQECEKLEDERNMLKKNFIASIQEIQQKCGLKTIKLEEKLQVLRSELEKYNSDPKNNDNEI